MSKLPEVVRLHLNDSKGELDRLRQYTDQVYRQNKWNENSAESRAMYSAYTIILELHAAIEGIAQFLDGKK